VSTILRRHLCSVPRARHNDATDHRIDRATNLSFCPPEEKAEAQATGACWDADSKRRYIDSGEPATKYSRWLSDAERDEEFTITSAEAYVAAATTACQRCHSSIQVICIHCESGMVRDDPLNRFSVPDVWAIDDSLARQIGRWPNYRKVIVQGAEDGYFANHCPNCRAPQDDMYLHSEPDETFFDNPGAAPGSIELTPLAGSIQLSGDEHFQVD
jgi:hypothetical protein